MIAIMVRQKLTPNELACLAAEAGVAPLTAANACAGKRRPRRATARVMQLAADRLGYGPLNLLGYVAPGERDERDAHLVLVPSRVSADGMRVHV